MEPHRFTLRVYYEDTDLAGIVYYANYLKFIERARSEWVRSLGIDQSQMRAQQGLVFAVRRLEADYLSPAHFDDELTVETTLHQSSGAKLILNQNVLHATLSLFTARVTLVCLTASGKATRLPTILTNLLNS